jgi:predicted N-acyltransferase
MVANTLEIIDPLQDRRWDRFVDEHPLGCIYARSDWIRVIAATYKQIKPNAVALTDAEGAIKAALPYCIVSSPLTGTRVVSLPFSSYCDPMLQDASNLPKLLDAILSVLHQTRASYYELRSLRTQDAMNDERLKMHAYHKTHLLYLDGGFEKVAGSFHRDCIRRSVKKAVKSGITVREGAAENDFSTFYMMHSRTRKRLGLPIQPYRLFENMWKIMYPRYLTFLLAELNGVAVGGLILFKYRDTVSLEHITSLEQYLPLRPNHLLLHSAIERACMESYRVLDFGKTSPENKGLLDFKRRWGAEMFDAPYFYYPGIQGLMSFEQNDVKQKLLLFVGRHMPLPMARIMGRIVYRHLG